jgi:hypothetical protein
MLFALKLVESPVLANDFALLANAAYPVGVRSYEAGRGAPVGQVCIPVEFGPINKALL